MGYPLPSDRKFGSLFVAVFVLLALWNGWRGHSVRMFFWLAAAVFLAGVTVFSPTWLTPVNRAWMTLGEMLGRVISPVVLGVLYGLLIIPVGFIMHMTGRDAMRRRYSDAASYWQDRTDGAMAPDRFKNQF